MFSTSLVDRGLIFIFGNGFDSSSKQFTHTQTYSCGYNCVNCARLESLLNEVLLQLSPSQYIINLLYKELNEITAQRMSVSNDIVRNKVCNEQPLLTTWTGVSSKYSCGKTETVSPESLQSWRPVPVSNNYSVPFYLSESTTGGEETVSSKSGKAT
jgi:hypothetical protein